MAPHATGFSVSRYRRVEVEASEARAANTRMWPTDVKALVAARLPMSSPPK